MMTSSRVFLSGGQTPWLWAQIRTMNGMPWITSTGWFVVTFLRQKHRISGRDQALIQQRSLQRCIYFPAQTLQRRQEAPRTADVLCSGETGHVLLREMQR